MVAWLRGPPKSEKAVAFRCSTAEGPKLVRVSPTAARPWSQAAKAIEALETTKVEALCKSGEILRVLDLSIPGEEAAAEERGRSARESEMVLIAKLIAEAHEHSSKLMREANSDAFDALLGLTKTVFARLDMLEKAWTKALGQQIRDGNHADEGEGEGLSVDSLIQTFIGAKMQAELAKASTGAPPAAKPPAAGKSNGAAPKG